MAKRRSKKPKKTRKPRTIQVRGYWVIFDSGAPAYYVPPHTRKRAKKPKKQPRYYCWRVSVLVSLLAGYVQTFVPESFDDEPVDTRVHLFLHTPFTLAKKQSVRHLRSLIAKTLKRDPGCEFLSYTLYHVYGPGPVSDKHWHLLETYLDFDDLPQR